MRARNVTGPIAHHAEGPVWADTWGGLRWVDGDAGDMLTLRDGEVLRTHVDDEYLAFVRPRQNGGFVAVGARTLYLADSPDADAVPVKPLLDDPAIRMNDGCADPQGRLLTGSMAYASTPGAADLRRVEADLSVHPVRSGLTVSNGIDFSPAGDLMFHVDTMTRRIDVYDVVDGEIVDPRTFAAFSEDQGLPDGLCVAADGSVWVALWGGGAVHGYAPDGTMIARIELPVPQVSACTFGGEELDVLYITTSAQGLAPDHGTAAGSLFAAPPGVKGMPARAFAG